MSNMHGDTLTIKSSTNNKAGLNISTTCHKKRKSAITQFSREGSLSLTAYIEYVLKWIIREAMNDTKRDGRSTVKPRNVMNVLNQTSWLSSIMRNSEIRPSNGLLLNKEFDDRFKEIYYTCNVSKHTRMKNKRKLEHVHKDNLFLFDIKAKRIKGLSSATNTEVQKTTTKKPQTKQRQQQKKAGRQSDKKTNKNDESVKKKKT